MPHRVRAQRILIALDPAAPNGATLDALTGLTGPEPAEICGLFIEDVSLIGLSSLSFVREVALDTGVERAMNPAQLERQLQAQRIRVERMLKGAVRRFSLNPDFKVTRGKVLEELRREGENADLVLVGRSPAQAGTRSWMGIRLGSLAAEIGGVLAIIQDAWLTGQSVAVIYDGSECAIRCMALAQRIALSERLPLSVILVGTAHDFPHWRDALRADPVIAPVQRWNSIDPSRLGELGKYARAACARVIVLPGHLEKQHPELIESLLRTLDCSIVAVGEHERISAAPGQQGSPATAGDY